MEKDNTRRLVDGGAAVNLMPYTMLRKIGKSNKDLTQTDMMLVDFEGNVSPAQGATCVELTIGSKTLPTTFFVIKERGSYNLLLGQDWIHANCCIPSTMHHPMDRRFSRVSCISGKAWDTEYLKVSDFGLKPVQAVGSDDEP
jgi:hypothetical protein